MTPLKVRFDGHVLIPEEPVMLPQDRVFEIYMHDVPDSHNVDELATSPLLELAEAIKDLPHDDKAPKDGAAQHDHYLYGSSKRP